MTVVCFVWFDGHRSHWPPTIDGSRFTFTGPRALRLRAIDEPAVDGAFPESASAQVKVPYCTALPRRGRTTWPFYSSYTFLLARGGLTRAGSMRAMLG